MKQKSGRRRRKYLWPNSGCGLIRAEKDSCILLLRVQAGNEGTHASNTYRFVLYHCHSFILAISIAPLQVLYYSEAFPTTARIYCIGVSRRSAQATVGKGLAQGPYTWRLKRESNPQPSDWKSSTQPIRHHVPQRANLAGADVFGNLNRLRLLDTVNSLPYMIL